MARARKKKAKPARKRAAKRSKTVAQSSSTWQIGAGVLALAVILGAAIYAVSLNEGPRTSVANFVEKFEVPQAVKEFPEKVRQNLPEIPAINGADGANNQESAPAE